MYKQSQRISLWLISAIMIIAMQSCDRAKQVAIKDLMIVEQTDSVCGGHEENNYCQAFFDIDVSIII